MGERRITLVLVLVFVALSAPPAQAALYMEFDPPRARPGTVVTGRTVGDGALAIGTGRALPVVLDPFHTKERIPIGHVIVDERGNGILKFTVPDTPGGKYTVLMSCMPCAPYSAGRTEVPIGDFRVVGPPPPPPPPSDETQVPGALIVAAVCVLLASLALRRRLTPSAVTKSR
jgi:hypothetical protein